MKKFDVMWRVVVLVARIFGIIPFRNVEYDKWGMPKYIDVRIKKEYFIYPRACLLWLPMAKRIIPRFGLPEINTMSIFTKRIRTSEHKLLLRAYHNYMTIMNSITLLMYGVEVKYTHLGLE